MFYKSGCDVKGSKQALVFERPQKGMLFVNKQEEVLKCEEEGLGVHYLSSQHSENEFRCNFCLSGVFVVVLVYVIKTLSVQYLDDRALKLFFPVNGLYLRYCPFIKNR